MPLSRLGAVCAAGADGAGTDGAGADGAEGGGSAFWPSGGMPLSRPDAAGAAGAGGAGEGGLFWPGAVMPPSRLGAAAPPLFCAVASLPGSPIAATVAPTTDRTQIRLLKRKTPHPRLEPHPPKRPSCHATPRVRSPLASGRPSRQVTNDLTNFRKPAKRRSFQVAKTINVSTNANPMRNPNS